MKPGRVIAVTLLTGCLCSSAVADKVTRTVDESGTPVITIHGTAKPAPPVTERPQATPPQKPFQVYHLEGEGSPSPKAQAPQVVVISSPPPIAPNPAAYYGWGYPWYPAYGPVCPPGPWGNFPAGPAVNYQARPLNYQNPPVNYQNPPVDYQPRP